MIDRMDALRSWRASSRLFPWPLASGNSGQEAAGEVHYVSAFCSKDKYKVAPNGGQWKAKHRGVCLVSEITATVDTSPDSTATPYKSSIGTSHSHFAVVQQGVAPSFSFKVYELSDGSDNAIPADYVEPKTVQK